MLLIEIKELILFNDNDSSPIFLQVAYSFTSMLRSQSVVWDEEPLRLKVPDKSPSSLVIKQQSHISILFFKRKTKAEHIVKWIVSSNVKFFLKMYFTGKPFLTIGFCNKRREGLYWCMLSCVYRLLEWQTYLS